MFRFASHQHSSSSIQRLLALATCALFLGIATPAVAVQLAASGHIDSQSGSSSLSSKAKIPRLAFVSPTFGAAETGNNVAIELKLSSDAAKLKVKLNGHDVTDVMGSSSCRGQICTMTGTVGKQQGLKDGENLLRASISVPGAGGEVRRISFSYQDLLGGGDGGNTILKYEPASVGFSTVAPGGASSGSPWIQVTTGSTMGIVDNVASFPALKNANNTISIPYRDAQFSGGCTTTLLAIVLNRQIPNLEETTGCGDSATAVESSIQSSLGRAPDERDLVILGTTIGKTAPAGLNTAVFGGTDYSKTPSSAYPQTYMLIGFKGATPGSAHENYSVAQGTDTPYQYPASLKGTLMEDSDGNYNYVPSDDRLLSVTSGADPKSTSITIGRQTYSPPPVGGGAFWLLVLDRELLQPVNYPSHAADGAPWTPCAYGETSQTSCGGLFPITADYPNVAADLAATLSSISPRNLVFLVGVGCPFQSASQVPAALGAAVAALGGVQYSLLNLNPVANTCAYSLVSVNDGKHSNVLTEKAALSANQYSAQGQLGALQGFVARDNSGLYDVAGKAQAGKGGATSVDYTFEKVAASQRTDWPLTSTSSLLAAYHDISYQMLFGEGETGSYDYDMRYFYTDANGVAANLTSSSEITRLGTLTQSTWNTQTTAGDFGIAKKQLASELQELSSARGYLIGSDGFGGIRGILNSSETPILSNMLGAANDISIDLGHAADSQNVDASASNTLNMAAGIVSIATAISTPIPPLAIGFGIMSGALWTGSAVMSFGNSSTIPGPESYYAVTLADLGSDSGKYATNVLSGFDGAADNIFTDVKKLQTVSGLTSNSDSGWNIKNLTDIDGMNTVLVSGGARSLMLEVLPNLYGTRAFFDKDTTDPSHYGFERSLPNVFPWPYTYCDRVYKSIPAASMKAYPSLDTPTKYDVYILAEGTKVDHNYSYKAKDTAMSSDLALLLTTSDSSSGLNIAPDLLFNFGGPLPSGDAGHFSHQACSLDLLGGTEASSFTITGPSTGVVGQRSGGYMITPTGQDGKLNPKFVGKVAVELTGPGNTRLHTNITFHGNPERIDFRSVYPKPGLYTLKVTSGSLDATKQITVESVEVEERVSATKVPKNTSVTLTAEVSANGQPITDGRILFTLNNRTLDSAPVGSGGEVSFTTNRLPVGTNHIAAVYRSPQPYGTVEASDVLTVRVIQRN